MFTFEVLLRSLEKWSARKTLSAETDGLLPFSQKLLSLEEPMRNWTQLSVSLRSTTLDLHIL